MSNSKMSTPALKVNSEEEDLPVATPVENDKDHYFTMLKGNEADLLVISAEQLDEVIIADTTDRKRRKKKKTAVLAGVATGVVALIVFGPVAGILAGIAGICFAKNMLKNKQQSKFEVVKEQPEKQRNEEDLSCFSSWTPR